MTVQSHQEQVDGVDLLSGLSKNLPDFNPRSLSFMLRKNDQVLLLTKCAVCVVCCETGVTCKLSNTMTIQQ